MNPRLAAFSIVNYLRYMLNMLSIYILPLSISIPITAMSSFSVLFFQHFFFNNKITTVDIAAGLIVTIGIIVINFRMLTTNSEKNKETKSYIQGLIMLIISVAFSGLSTVVAYNVTTTTSIGMYFLIESTYTCIGGILLWLVYTFNSRIFGQNILPNGSEVCTSFFFFMIVNSLALLSRLASINLFKPYVFSIFSNFTVIISVIVGVCVFKEALFFSNILGIILILVACLLVSHDTTVTLNSLFSLKDVQPRIHL
jgi:drug/metabolite transporter (DMT)-like permease